MALSLSKRIKYDEVTGHFHIGQNMPGYLPEREVVCADNLADAIEYLVDELNLSQDQLMDPDGDDEDEYNRIESVKVSASDKDLHRQAYRELESFKNGTDTLGNLISFLHTPRQGADIVHWISVHRDSRSECLVAEGQDW
jgi:hypothetical protein